MQELIQLTFQIMMIFVMLSITVIITSAAISLLVYIFRDIIGRKK